MYAASISRGSSLRYFGQPRLQWWMRAMSVRLQQPSSPGGHAGQIYPLLARL